MKAPSAFKLGTWTVMPRCAVTAAGRLGLPRQLALPLSHNFLHHGLLPDEATDLGRQVPILRQVGRRQRLGDPAPGLSGFNAAQPCPLAGLVVLLRLTQASFV